MFTARVLQTFCGRASSFTTLRSGKAKGRSSGIYPRQARVERLTSRPITSVYYRQDIDSSSVFIQSIHTRRSIHQRLTSGEFSKFNLGGGKSSGNLSSAFSRSRGCCFTRPCHLDRSYFTMSTDDAQQFEEVFHQLIDELIDDDAANPEIADAAARFKEMLVYTVPGGKRNRGLTVVSAFRQLASSAQNTVENIRIAHALGWCVEWLQAYFLIADDMMDQSKTRRGKPCWYRREAVGNVAINDSFYTEACIYKILKKLIRNQPYYMNIMELFHETTYQTIMGQALDLITSPEGNRDLTRFTEDRYAAIVKWKTAFYSFYLPVALAMYMAGIDDAKSHANAKVILLQMGHFFQVQDDYLDCYGNPEVIGKIGTDIEENKCGWLVVQALKIVDAEQRKLLEENYGIDDPDKVSKIKELYKTLDLESVYRQHEESSYNHLMDLIEEHSQTLPKDIFIAFAKRIYKRKK